MSTIKQKLKDEMVSLARQISPSVIRCVGSPHRPKCQIPLYHNMLEEKIRREFLDRVRTERAKISPFSTALHFKYTLDEDEQTVIQVVNDRIDTWCIYCIVSQPKLNSWFDWGARKVNKLALKRYDKKYGEAET